MTETPQTAEASKFRIEPVSRWYRNDWQFASDVVGFSFLEPAAIAITLMPFVVNVTTLLGAALPPTIWLTWLTAVSFFFASVIYFVRCPEFVREYRDFGKYKLRQHSHRWVVWEFFLTVRSLKGWKNLVKETEEKNLTVSADSYAGKPVGTALDQMKDYSIKDKPSGVFIFTPVNVDRDIYLPIIDDGKRLVLPLLEADCDREAKERELFWILYSEAVKERPGSRATFWILVYLSAALLVLNIVVKIAEVVSKLTA